MKLRNDVGAIEIKALGIKLTTKSTAEQIKRAVEHRPSLKKFMDK